MNLKKNDAITFCMSSSLDIVILKQLQISAAEDGV